MVMAVNWVFVWRWVLWVGKLHAHTDKSFFPVWRGCVGRIVAKLGRMFTVSRQTGKNPMSAFSSGGNTPLVYPRDRQTQANPQQRTNNPDNHAPKSPNMCVMTGFVVIVVPPLSCRDVSVAQPCVL